MSEWGAVQPEAFGAESWGGEVGDGALTIEDSGVVLDRDGYEALEMAANEKKPKRVRKKDVEHAMAPSASYPPTNRHVPIVNAPLKTDRENGEEKFISIWQRSGKNEPLQSFVDKFPRNAAMAFSEVWKRELENEGSFAALVIDDENLDPYKRLLDWINQCVDEGNDIKFPEIEDEENALNILLEIIVVADQLKVPEMSLQEGLKKRAMKYARKGLINLDYVERLYDEGHFQYLGPSEALQEAASASIFEAWWTRKLDEPEYNDYCSFIEQMRAVFPKLDEDLNKRFDDKKEHIEKKKAEKKAQQAAPYNSSNNGADGGWGSAAAATVDGSVEWRGADEGGTADGAAAAAMDGYGTTAEGDTSAWNFSIDNSHGCRSSSPLWFIVVTRCVILRTSALSTRHTGGNTSTQLMGAQTSGFAPHLPPSRAPLLL
ncbi:hypothetical protein M406DRAFT_331564 [Cryphonectria parasitica EP155]|uniref:Uncharacterized protein n=1 Tax=Cryphonectria parasitica (strain ATCC 38755 / EP155) TaxID=660469 RepID=A0A9P4XY02_CRYP1|nr:uncharacterized protein M406DRAFT_331564 [Cryphonectria parasitica EP155]KAF3762991.1 hypothetical protein M406DRAFT_331564 [Cryphonectria parasitica EP155]